MTQSYENDFAYVINKGILSQEQMKKIDKYAQEYQDKSEEYILNEIMKVKSQVSPSIINQHIKNLDHLSQMEGFVTEDMKYRISRVKNVLETPLKNPQTNPESQFFGGGALLLWFLVLAAIWRRPYYYRRPYRRPRY